MEERRQAFRYNLSNREAGLINCVLCEGQEEIELELLNFSLVGMNCNMPPGLLSRYNRDSILHFRFSLKDDSTVSAQGQIIWKDEFEKTLADAVKVGVHLLFFNPEEEQAMRRFLESL